MASTKETILEELDFLDKIALDESPKGKSKGKSNKSKPNTKTARKPNLEISETSEEAAILKYIEGLSDDAALAVIAVYKSLPEEVKDAVGRVYDEIKGLGIYSTMESVKDALVELKELCGEWYSRIYEATLKDAKRVIPKIQMRQMTEDLGELSPSGGDSL